MFSGIIEGGIIEVTDLVSQLQQEFLCNIYFTWLSDFGPVLSCRICRAGTVMEVCNPNPCKVAVVQGEPGLSSSRSPSPLPFIVFEMEFRIAQGGFAFSMEQRLAWTFPLPPPKCQCHHSRAKVLF